jgi:hypothetical protein
MEKSKKNFILLKKLLNRFALVPVFTAFIDCRAR